MKDAIVQKQNTSSEVVGGGEAGISGQAANIKLWANSAKNVTKALKEVMTLRRLFLFFKKKLRHQALD